MSAGAVECEGWMRGPRGSRDRSELLAACRLVRMTVSSSAPQLRQRSQSTRSVELMPFASKSRSRTSSPPHRAQAIMVSLVCPRCGRRARRKTDLVVPRKGDQPDHPLLLQTVQGSEEADPAAVRKGGGEGRECEGPFPTD